jgi:hypothetical protein
VIIPVIDSYPDEVKYVRRMHYFKWLSSILLAALLTCTTLFGQSASSLTPAQTFHVQGTVRGYRDQSVSGIKVTFQSNSIIKTVSSDKEGFYEIDLPTGLYTMTAELPGRDYLEYRRPLFQVSSSTILTFNITLERGQGTCDLMIPVGGPPPNGVDQWNGCGGWDSFPVPSEGHVPFELSIQFGTRQATDHLRVYDGTLNPSTEPSYVYRSGWNPSSSETVFVAYNLFTLRAEHVVYDMQARTLQATGNVVMTNAYGVSRYADSLRFKIENGDATPLQ